MTQLVCSSTGGKESQWDATLKKDDLSLHYSFLTILAFTTTYSLSFTMYTTLFNQKKKVNSQSQVSRTYARTKLQIIHQFKQVLGGEKSLSSTQNCKQFINPYGVRTKSVIIKFFFPHGIIIKTVICQLDFFTRKSIAQADAWGWENNKLPRT